VREQVFAHGLLGNFLEVERLPNAAQDLDGRFGKRHVELRECQRGYGSFPLAARKKVEKAY
jgi:hypothetical protein